MSITGKFVLESNENYEAWLAAVGVPAEVQPRLLAAKPVLEVTKTDTGVSIKTTSGDKVFSNSVVYGVDSPAEIGALKYTLNVNQNPKGYSGTVKLGDKSGTFVVEDTATGFVQTVTVAGVAAKRTYKRQ